MPFHSLYKTTAEVYLWAGVFMSPILCVLGWLLLGRAVSKHIHTFVYWFLPSMIGSSFIAAALLLTAFLRSVHSRDYALGSGVYLLSLMAMPFHVVSFARLWKIITSLPPSSGELPPQDAAAEDAGVWPPSPRR